MRGNFVNVYFGKQYGARKKLFVAFVRLFGALSAGLNFQGMPGMLEAYFGRLHTFGGYLNRRVVS